VTRVESSSLLTRQVRVELTADAEDFRLELIPNASSNKPTSSSETSMASDQPRLEKAAERYLELDAAANSALARNRTVVIDVPKELPRVQSRRRNLRLLDDYRNARMPSKIAIRPLLLPEPPVDYLREFQARGVSWLLAHKRAILADDMGLGKTVQAISALRLLIARGQVKSVLVVCPKSLLRTWEYEIGRWAPELWTICLAPPARLKEQAWALIADRCHVCVTNYEQMRNPPLILKSRTPDLLIADEAHRLRGPNTQTVQGLRLVSSEWLWALTGTPIERDVDDLATLLSFIEPHRFSARDAQVGVASLRAQSRRYVLRRLKTDVLSELPAVILSKEPLELSPSQRKEYDHIRSKPWPRGSGESLKRINELRSLCDYDPATGNSSKIDRIIEILQDVSRAGEKAVVFSYLIKPLELLEKRLLEVVPDSTVQILVGSLDAQGRAVTVDAFRKTPGFAVLLCSSRVGGEGLTLTEANHVIFVNEWWNPSANSQARDRLVRIGQKRVVYVRSFRCNDTIEELLEEILAKKTDLFTQVVDALSEDVALSEPVGKLIRELRAQLSVRGSATHRSKTWAAR